jgi:hypothetical protein
MAGQQKTPIIVGVREVKNPSRACQDPIEPMQLMLQAIREALNDTGLSASTTKKLYGDIDSVSVIASSTWQYEDLPSLKIPKNTIFSSLSPPIIRRLNQLRKPTHHPRPLFQKFFCNFPAPRIRWVPPYQQTTVLRRDVPESYDIDAQLTVVQLITGRNQIITHPGEREEIHPGMMRNFVLYLRRP